MGIFGCGLYLSMWEVNSSLPSLPCLLHFQRSQSPQEEQGGSAYCPGGRKRWERVEKVEKHPRCSWCLPCPGASRIINPWEPLGAGEGLLGDVWDKEKLHKHLRRLLVYMWSPRERGFSWG